MRNLMIRTLTVTALAAGLAFGQSDGKAMGKLSLTPEQKEQAKAIFAQAKRDIAPLKQELKQNRQAMAEAIRNGRSDSEIRQLAAAQGSTLGQMIALRSQARARFVAELTPEQKAEIRGKLRDKALRKLAKRKLG